MWLDSAIQLSTSHMFCQVLRLLCKRLHPLASHHCQPARSQLAASQEQTASQPPGSQPAIQQGSRASRGRLSNRKPGNWLAGWMPRHINRRTIVICMGSTHTTASIWDCVLRRRGKEWCRARAARSAPVSATRHISTVASGLRGLGSSYRHT